MAAAAILALTTAASAQTAADKPSVAVICKAGGKMVARVRAGGPVILRFTPGSAAAKDAEPGDGQCAFKDTAMGDKAPKRLRSRTPEAATFLVDKLLKGGVFEVQAFDNGKGVLIVTATGPAATP